MRGGLKHELQTNWWKTLRQPIFGNFHTKSCQKEVLTTKDSSKLILWSKGGFYSFDHLWDKLTYYWTIAPYMQHILRFVGTTI